MNEKTLWEKCVAFHGHACGGLTIGYKAALLAIQEMGITFSKDEEIVCVSENDACGVDAIQVILSCTAGKGNLLFHITGKSAYSFYDRKSGKSLRLLLKPAPEGMTKADSFAYFQSKEPAELFTVMPARLPLPEKAKLFGSTVCEACGETAGNKWIRNVNGRQLCLDCARRSEEARV